MAFEVREFEEATTWESLKVATPERLRLDAEKLKSATLSSAKAFVRGDDPKMTLYRDSAAWCPYCQKCWILLEETKASYRIEKINMACYGDKPRSFFEVQPSGTLPAAVLLKKNNVVLGSSDEIVREILDTSDVRSVDGRDDPRSRELLQLERVHFSAWLRWLTGGDSGKLPFIRVLDKVEEAIDGPFFLGERFTHVDAIFAPFLERMAASLAYFKGYVVRKTDYLENTETNDDLQAFRRYPKLNKWFDAMETRPAYQATMADFYTHAHDLPPQLGGCVSARSPHADAVRADVDGDCWTPNAQPKYEANWNWIPEPKEEAAARLSDNGPNVAVFAARAVGIPGFPPARAELADPRALADENIVPIVDALLRLIVLRLRNQENDATSKTLISSWLPKTPQRTKAAAYAKECLAYLRDRVGVPRDMSLPAALALRQDCNALITILEDPTVLNYDNKHP